MIQVLMGSGAASALPSTTYPHNFPLKIGLLETKESRRPQSFGPRDCEARLLPACLQSWVSGSALVPQGHQGWMA